MIINDEKKILNFFYEITKNENKEISYIKNLLQVYPNILEYMLKNETPNLSNVQYVKYKRYNYLKEKVLDNYNILELNEMLNDCFDFSILKKLFEHFSMDYDTRFEKMDNVTKKSICNAINKKIKQLIISNPYNTLCKLKGIGFIKADNILLKVNNSKNKLWHIDLKTSIFRCNSFILYYLINCLNGSTFTYISNLKNQMISKFNLIECLDVFEDALNDPRIKIINDKIMLTSTFLEEQNISNFIKVGINEDIQDNWNIDVFKYSELNGFKLTNNQLKTLEFINKNQLVLLNGFAGTGKSSSIKALINMLEDNGITYKILAPTGKAAKTISNYTDREASTIHYLLCHDFPDFDYTLDDENEYNNISNLEFYKNTKKGSLTYDILIIDESSMLSVSLFNILIKYIDLSKTKVLLIGDSYQLPSIQHGNLYQDLLEIEEIPKVTLDEIFRYTENGLINVATNIRHGNNYLSNLEEQEIKKIGDSYIFQQTKDNKMLLNLALNKYMELIEKDGLNNVAILTAKNVGGTGTYVVNNLIQKIINKSDDFYSLSIKIDDNQIIFKKNDIVMNIKNNYNAIPIGKEEPVLLANGQTGIIKDINVFDSNMIVTIDEEDYEFKYEDIKNLRLAYCFTIHKAQGSQFKNIIYLTSSNDVYMTSSNLLYVGVTRAQNCCYHYGDYNAINTKINVRENLKRNTTLVLQFYKKF